MKSPNLENIRRLLALGPIHLKVQRFPYPPYWRAGQQPPASNDSLGAQIRRQRLTIFIDEVHLVPRAHQESLLTMLEAADRTVVLSDHVARVQKATFMFATTRVSDVDPAFASRCDEIQLRDYTEEQVAQILRRKVPHDWPDEIYQELAKFGRCVPRVARNTKELLEFADFFRQSNADMISLQEKIDTSTPAGRLFYTMIAAMAQWEREEIVDRVKASVSIRAKLGHPLGGPASFGYCWKDKKLVPHPKEAPVRKLMYDLFLEHRRKRTVVRLLNQAGHRTRKGAQFTSKTVSRLLQDPTAKGVHLANYTTRDGNTKRWSTKSEDQWVTTEVEAIVKPEVWEQCNQLLNQSHQAQRRPAKKAVHLFAGIAHCECGEKMYVPSNSPKYICRKCRNKIAIVDLEGIFCDEIQGYSISADKIKAYLEKADDSLAEKERLLELQRSELQKTRTEVERVYRLYQDGQLDSTGFGKFYKPLEERTKQLEADIPRLLAEIDTGKIHTISAQEVVSEAQNLHRLWPNLEAEEKRKLVESITEKIVVGKDEIDITFCYLSPFEDMAKRWRKGEDSNLR